MRVARLVALVAALLLAGVVLAKIPDGQGRACDAKNKCATGMSCVTKKGMKPTCEIVCAAASARCPEDQRCVKDGGQMICRPITDIEGTSDTPF